MKVNIQSVSPNNSTPDWQAHLKLGFVHKNGKTVLSQRQHRGPLTVQRPFYPEGGVCHVYLLHPPGGVVAGDSLTIEANAGTDSTALLTTPAAGKFYRSEGKQARQQVLLTVEEDASLEWLPQETIVYQGARVESALRLEIKNSSRFIAWDVVALGRPAANEGFDEGFITMNWQILRDGVLCYRERLQIDATAFKARWGLQGHSSFGTLFAYPCDATQLEVIQALIGEHPSRAVTRIDELLICRALDARADVLRDSFQQVWQILRTDSVKQTACTPRIWAT
jgi:urease accessory protein